MFLIQCFVLDLAHQKQASYVWKLSLPSLSLTPCLVSVTFLPTVCKLVSLLLVYLFVCVHYCREARYGKILGPYLDDPSNLFIISSDFCHWGSRFNYTFYDKSQVWLGDGASVLLRSCCLCWGSPCTVSLAECTVTIVLCVQDAFAC